MNIQKPPSPIIIQSILIITSKLKSKKGEYRDGIKSRETRLGWIDACCHGDDL